MTFVHGKGTGVLVDQYDLSTYFNQASVSKGAQTVDTTTFGSDWRTFMAGIEEGDLSMSGLFDATAGTSHPVLDAALGSASGQIITVGIDGIDTIGNVAFVSQAREISYQIRTVTNDAVRITANSTADGGIQAGHVLHSLTQRTSGANYASVDNGASSAFGAVGTLHVTQFSGTNCTIKITDSANDSTFGDLITFTTVSAVGSERSTVSGTVEQYARVELSGTFTSVTFAVGFARYRH